MSKLLAKSKIDPFKFASSYFPTNVTQNTYYERTCRNHFWIGGELGQKKIQKMSVAVAGLGGIGGNIAEALVRLGVGQLRIADLDRIDYSNINRQVMAKQSTLKMNKADAMAQELRNLANDYELIVYNQGVVPEMVEEFTEECDAIVDEIDVFALDRKVDLHRTARKKNIPLYTAYVVGLGIHFYKFYGTEYTIEDYLGSEQSKWKKPDGKFILDKIGHPLPNYINKKEAKRYEAAINTGGAPIFGPATLLGHSLVTTRLLMDHMGNTMQRQGFEKTPTMPEFLVLDAANFTFSKHRMPNM